MGESQGPKTGTRLSAVEIHDNIIRPGEEELHRATTSLFFSSLASGLAIGFSFVAGGYVMSFTPARFDIAAASLVYPLGFILVIIARLELFTENTVVPVIPLLRNPGVTPVRRLLRVWLILLIGNLLGAAVFATALALTPMVPEPLHPHLGELARHATDGGFWRVTYQAVFAGWLIAMLSWLLASTYQTGAQLVLIWLCTAPIAAFGFRHSIAGSVEALYRVARDEAPLMAMAGDFIVPAVVGNAIGGVLLVALLNYAQVAPEMETETQWRPVGSPGVATRPARRPRPRR